MTHSHRGDGRTKSSRAPDHKHSAPPAHNNKHSAPPAHNTPAGQPARTPTHSGSTQQDNLRRTDTVDLHRSGHTTTRRVNEPTREGGARTGTPGQTRWQTATSGYAPATCPSPSATITTEQRGERRDEVREPRKPTSSKHRARRPADEQQKQGQEGEGGDDVRVAQRSES